MRPSLSDRMQRLLAVLAWLAENQKKTNPDTGNRDTASPKPTVSELADRFGVSIAQMQKDLEQATMSGYGPDTDAGSLLGFFVDDDGTVEAYALERDLVGPTRLSQAEAFAVLTAGRAALELDPSLDALRSAMTKLARALGADMDDVVDVDLGAPDCLHDFRLAEAEHRRLHISYWTASRDEVTERYVDPLYVFFRDGAWYARCIDHPNEPGGEPGVSDQRGSGAAPRRLFRLDRVTACEPTEHRFEPPGAIDTTDGVLDLPPDSRPVTIRFPESSRWVVDYLELRDVEPDGPGGDADGTERGGSFTAVLDVVGTAFLDQWLVRSRGEVLDPPDLRKRTQLAAAAIMSRYR